MLGRPPPSSAHRSIPADDPKTQRTDAGSSANPPDAATADQRLSEQSKPRPKLCEHPLNGDPNTGEVRAGHCPLCEPNKCPEGCGRFTGQPLDTKRHCWGASVVLDCIPAHSIVPEGVGYYVDVVTGVVYQTPGLGLGPPRFEEHAMGDAVVAPLGITTEGQPKACDPASNRPHGRTH